MSSKDARIAALENKLKSDQSGQSKMKAEIQKREDEIVALRTRISELEAQRASAAKPANIAEIEEKSAEAAQKPEGNGEPKDPTAIIDWLMKKKSK